MSCGQRVERWEKKDGKRTMVASGTCILERGHDPEVGHKILADVTPAAQPDPVTAYDVTGKVLWTCRLMDVVDPETATVAALMAGAEMIAEAHHIEVNGRVIKQGEIVLAESEKPLEEERIERDATASLGGNVVHMRPEQIKPTRSLDDQLAMLGQLAEAMRIHPEVHSHQVPGGRHHIATVTLPWSDFEDLARLAFLSLGKEG